MNKKQLKEEMKQVIIKYEEGSDFKIDWVKVTRKKAVGFSPANNKEITINVKFRSM